MYLKPPYPIHHSLELDALDVLVLAVDPLDPEDVVTEVQTLEPPLLGEEHDHHAARPVEALAKQLLHCELVLANCKKKAHWIIRENKSAYFIKAKLFKGGNWNLIQGKFSPLSHYTH